MRTAVDIATHFIVPTDNEERNHFVACIHFKALAGGVRQFVKGTEGITLHCSHSLS
jgi:hypothetical protein